MHNVPKGARMLFCAALYAATSLVVVGLAALVTLGWNANGLSFFVITSRTLLVTPPLAFAFWIPLMAIECAVFAWRPHATNARRETLLAVLLIATGLPTIVFGAVMYLVVEVYAQYRVFLDSLMPLAVGLGCCVPLFITVLLLAARGGIRRGAGNSGTRDGVLG